MVEPGDLDLLLDEWARWARHDPLKMGWSNATPIGRMIKPDPAPSREPVDPERAFATDRVVVRLPQRYRFLINLHYRDPAPIDAKARRLRRGREAYKATILGMLRAVAPRFTSKNWGLTQPREKRILCEDARAD